MINVKSIWNDLKKIKEQAPLVHNITNYVVMNNTANALLAIGASPVMAHAENEVKDMVNIASSLVINIGTLSDKWVSSMQAAMKAAKDKGIPIVFDPVGAGATPYRSQVCELLLNSSNPQIIRGNASEIMSLINSEIKTKGVDSSAGVDSAKSAAQELAKMFKCIVVVSGEVDLITDGENELYVKNGNPMMPKVTGLGCTATALVGAFAAINQNYLLASAHAMAVMGICGEIAVQNSAGPASLQLNIIDAFYNLTEENVEKYLR